MYKLENVKYTVTDFGLRVDNIRFQKGDIYAVAGPNGSGKTTLLNILGFLLKPQSGKISFDGKNINYSSEKLLLGIRRNISYNLQTPYLFDTTVYENISCGLKIRRFPASFIKKRTENIISVFSLQDIAYKNARKISGGQLQKVSLARSLVADTPVLLLDEPFAGLDKKSSLALENLILNLNETREKTIIIATHQNQAHKLAKNILSVDNGIITQSIGGNIFSGELIPAVSNIKEMRLFEANAVKVL